jgi:hypothetical protein
MAAAEKVRMRTMLLALLLGALVVLRPNVARAEEVYCQPDGIALSRELIIMRLEELGYKRVGELGFEHGCYETRAQDARGNRVRLVVEPTSGEVVAVAALPGTARPAAARQRQGVPPAGAAAAAMPNMGRAAAPQPVTRRVLEPPEFARRRVP